MKKTNVNGLVLCVMFSAMSAILSQLTIPLWPVPINMTHLSIFLAAGLLGARYGAISQAVFVLLGAVGVPVFSGFTGGLGIMAGPTGGFILGYIACAFITGLIIDRFGRSMLILMAGMALGMLATYILGISWFMYQMKMGFYSALTVCIVPFLIGDALKILLSSVLVKRVNPVVHAVIAKLS